VAEPRGTTDTAADVKPATAVAEDPTAAGLSDAELTTVAPDVLAQSLGDYFGAWGRRIRNGESGALPIILGLVVIVLFFQIEQSTFLSSGNLVNLFVEAAAYILFGAAEIWVLILSEIDLSVGYVAAVAAFVIAELIAAPVGLPWWLGIIGGLIVCAFLGWVQGTLITRLGLPSFIVTLGGLLGFEGVMLEIANIDKSAVGGVMSISSNSPVSNLVNGNISPILGWIALVVILAVFAAVTLTGTARRRARGLSTAPMSVTILRIVVTAIGGFVTVLICNRNSCIL